MFPQILQFFVEKGLIILKYFNHAPLKCFVGDLVKEFLKKFMQDFVASSIGALGSLKTDNIWVIIGPTIKANATSFASRCHACQQNSNKLTLLQ